MRWKRDNEKIVKRFLFFPLTLPISNNLGETEITRWLEWAEWKEYVMGEIIFGIIHFEKSHWTDLED